MREGHEMKILFLGASKRVSLLERFASAASAAAVPLKMYSCERNDDFCPISHLAQILPGPSFRGADFQEWLRKTVVDLDIELVVPNMDAATVALAEYSESAVARTGTLAAVSRLENCRAMEDKIAAEAFFRAHGIPTPENHPNRFPKIVKPSKGFGAKGIHIVRTAAELDTVLRAANGPMITQDFVEGVETTVDLYVDRRGRNIGAVYRDRLEVSDGEVMVCRTRPPTDSESALVGRIVDVGGWYGCITLQYITREGGGSPCVIEINPRFGGGATAAIEAGLDMPAYLMAEARGQSVVAPRKLRRLIMTRARRDFFCELDANG